MAKSSLFFAERRQLSEASEMSIASLRCAGATVANYRRDIPGLGISNPNPTSDMFMIVVSLRDLPNHSLWRNGKHLALPEMKTGSLACLDLRETWIADLSYAFDSFHAFIPRTCFDDVTREMRVPSINALRCLNTDSQHDATMHGLASAMVPMIAASRTPSALVADHILTAMVGHLALTYGDIDPPIDMLASSLGSSEIARVAELLLDDLKADVGLSTLAAACGLSVRQFQRAFKQAFGTTPHRWRAQHQVKLAQQRLEFTTDSLSDIAEACGFADQSHFTHVFSQIAGVSPGVYRRRVRL